MRDRRKSIVKLRIEIEELEKQIELAKESGKVAFAARLEKIMEIKNKRLTSWLRL